MIADQIVQIGAALLLLAGFLLSQRNVLDARSVGSPGTELEFAL